MGPLYRTLLHPGQVGDTDIQACLEKFGFVVLPCGPRGQVVAEGQEVSKTPRARVHTDHDGIKWRVCPHLNKPAQILWEKETGLVLRLQYFEEWTEFDVQTFEKLKDFDHSLQQLQLMNGR